MSSIRISSKGQISGTITSGSDQKLPNTAGTYITGVLGARHVICRLYCTVATSITVVKFTTQAVWANSATTFENSAGIGTSGRILSPLPAVAAAVTSATANDGNLGIPFRILPVNGDFIDAPAIAIGINQASGGSVVFVLDYWVMREVGIPAENAGAEIYGAITMPS